MPTRRPAGLDDVAPLLELYHVYDVAELGQPEMEAADIRAMIETDTGDSIVVEHDGRLVGFADAADSGEVETVVHPEHPEAADLQRELLSWVIDTARARGAQRLEHFTGPKPDGGARLLAEAGFEHARTVWRMRRELGRDLPEPVLPAGVQVRPFDADRDGRTVWALVQHGFDGTYGSHRRPFEEWALFSLGPERDAVCAYDGDELVAVATTGPRAGEGHVNQLTVDPAQRGRGLALALLHEAFRRDAEAGHPATSLTVDGENEHARRLYDKAGMAVTAEFHRWERDA